MLRQRLAGLLLIIPLLLGIGVAVYRFGPHPKQSLDQADVKASSAAVLPAAKPAPLENAGLLGLFGMYQTAVAKGRVPLAPAEYVNSLEEIYKQRGYLKIERFDPNTAVKQNKNGKAQQAEASAVKFFQRNDVAGVTNISATGVDADHGSNVAAPVPYTFNTVVAPAEGGGADWATYKLEIDQSKLEQLGQLESGDFPGTDPKDVPRLPGLQRLYALTTGNGSIAIYEGRETSDTALMLKYLEEMPRHGWRLDSSASAEANKLAAGVMCFTRGVRSCLIWVTPGKNTGTTNVTISSH